MSLASLALTPLAWAPLALAPLAPTGPLPSACQEVDQDEPTREEWVARAIGGWLTLPEDPYGRVFATLGADVVPVAPPAEALAALAPDAAEDAATWRRWSKTLARVVAASDRGEPAAAADLTTLALVAAGQRRAEDAWGWLTRHGPGAPEHLAGALAFLVPGVPATTVIGPGGRPMGLTSGARFAPVPPPKPGGTPDWQVAWREAEFRGLAIGEAVVDGKVVVEGSGSEVRLTHVSGAKTEVVVELAPELGYEISARYLDWEPRPEGAPSAATVVLAPGDEEHVYWGRFQERREQRPSVPPRGLRPAQLALGGLALAVDAVDPRRALVEGVAAELEALLAVRVRVVTRGGAALAAPGTGGDVVSAPIVIDLPPGDAGARTLGALATMVERFVMQG